MNPTTLIIGGVGALLIYCAVKDKDPRTVIAEALQPRKRARSGQSLNPSNAPIVTQPAPSYSGDPKDYFGSLNVPNV